MTGRESILEARVIWLTKAVRGLLKQEFGKRYAEMEVGKLDALISASEVKYAQAAKDFDDFLKDPSDKSALEKLSKLIEKKPSCPSCHGTKKILEDHDGRAGYRPCKECA